MIGHGGPTISQRPHVSTAGRGPARWGRVAALLVPLTLVLALAPRGLSAETMRTGAETMRTGAETMRIRIAWGGGAERRWEGTMAASEGTLSEPRPLGIEADEPGSMWLQADPQSGGASLVIRQRSPRSYDGVDLLVDAPLSGRLLVRLTAADDPENPISVEVPLAGLSGEFFDKVLDDRGNRLLVRRTPGDRLRVRLDRDSLVFSPGEVFRFTVEPHLLPLEDGSKVHLRTRLVRARSEEEFWSTEHEIRSGESAAIPLEVDLPQQEGVYDVDITATYSANWQQAVRRPLKPQEWNRTVARRSIQVLVLDAKPTAPGEPKRELHRVGAEINPANPNLWDKLAKLPKLPNVPRLIKGPLGNGNMTAQQHPLGEVVRLNPSGQSPDVSWEAYTLSVAQPGRPHVLEVDYPSDIVQTLGLSVLETNASGALAPIGLDSGVESSAEVAGLRPPARWMRHRLIFWPRTTAPVLLVTNLRQDAPATYGKIRVLAGWEHLPPAFSDRLPQGNRLLAAYYDRPLFPNNFSASQWLDGWSGRSLDDWQTFYQGGTRLVEYLQHVGYNGLIVSVLADGSTIYPSELLQATPRYDTGVFFGTGQDPLRKDVLEMLLRLCDREGLQLVPAIEFAAPLPELEAIRSQGGSAGETLDWIGPDGATWCQTHPTRRGLAPYYNVLRPQVQEAMLRVAHELIGRYAHHESFGGLAIQLSAHGYAQLPGPDWGMDDATIAHFEQDTGLRVPGKGERRFAQRAMFLNSEPHRRRWLDWRASQLAQLYRRMHAELTTIRPGSRLYLTGAEALTGTEVEADLRPALPRRTTIATVGDTLLRLGIDARLYRDDEGLVLLRPERRIPAADLNARAVDLEVRQMPDVDEYYRGCSVPGSLFFHQPRKVRVGSFDAAGPFRPSYTELYAQPASSGMQNRRRFVHSLATLDAQVIANGGWMLPLGQEHSIREVAAAYRRLPAVRFQRALGSEVTGGYSQPVTFRYGTHDGRTYVYAVNEAPFATAARVRVDAPAGCRLEELTGLRQVAPLKRDANGAYWMVKLRPYDLVAVQLSEPGAKLSEPKVVLPEVATKALGRQILELGARTASLRIPAAPLRVLSNPGFERPPADGSQLPGWTTTQQPGVTISPDATQKHAGRQSAKMATSGPWACLVSQPFEPSATGRLRISVWLRVADAVAQPHLRLAVEGKHNGRDYYRFAQVGKAPGAARAEVPIGAQWGQYVFPLDDLPLEGLGQLRVRCELLGPGEVWVDDVQLFDLQFDRHELTEFDKLVTLAHITLKNHQVGDCLRLLDGYWPRFLEENVPLQPSALRATRPVQAAKPAPPPPQRTGFMDRLKSMLPNESWF